MMRWPFFGRQNGPATGGDAHDGLRQRVLAAANRLGEDELLILVSQAEAMAAGREHYGDTPIDGDPRDFVEEALEEFRDATFYLTRDLLRFRRLRERVNGAAR